MKKFILLFLLISAKQVNAQLCISAPTYYVTGTNPTSLVTADFNNDGKKDLAELNESSGIYIRLGNGTGSFNAVDSFSIPSGSGAKGLFCADFNGDGAADLATSNYNSFSGTISVLLGTGNGTFGSSADFYSGFEPYSITGGDFNNDGKIDIAVGNSKLSGVSYSAVTILLGNGTGSFNSTTSYSVGTGSGSGFADPWSLTTADLNNDGFLDIITGNSYDNTISILFGTGTGTFGGLVNIGVGIGPTSVCSADFDGDGNKDIAVSNGISPQGVSVLLGSGTGSFSSITNYTINTGGGGVRSVFPVDYNNDSFTDLAVTFSNYPGKIGILPGTGTGSFSSTTSYTLVSSAYVGPVVGADFNNDGKVDLAALLYWSNQLAVFLNCTAVGVEDFNREEKQITVYPNPASKRFFIETSINEKVLLDLYDINGRHMLSKITNNRSNIDVSELPDGVYSVTITTKNSVINKKVAVLH